MEELSFLTKSVLVFFSDSVHFLIKDFNFLLVFLKKIHNTSFSEHLLMAASVFYMSSF